MSLTLARPARTHRRRRALGLASTTAALALVPAIAQADTGLEAEVFAVSPSNTAGAISDAAA